MGNYDGEASAGNIKELWLKLFKADTEEELAKGAVALATAPFAAHYLLRINIRIKRSS